MLVKWALKSITMNKASRDDGIPIELFQILKDGAMKMLHSNMTTNLENSSVAIGQEKVSFHSNPEERQYQRIFKLLHNCTHASKVMLKILQAKLQQYMNCELPDYQAGFRKGIKSEIKFPTSAGSLNKQESSRKTFTSASLTMLKLLTVWITTSCGKFFKRWEYQTTLPAS